MRVSIKHTPVQKGFLFKKPYVEVSCTVLFSHEELQILREKNLLDTKLMDRRPATAKVDDRDSLFELKVNDLTSTGNEYLSYHHTSEKHARPTGHWWRGTWVSAVSCAIEISARRNGREYMPAARIISLQGAPLAIPLGKGKLIPDQVFAIRYPEGYRAFVLEVDRGTEPVRSSAEVSGAGH